MGTNPTGTATVLGQSVGVYHERMPAATLRCHFACTWFHRLPSCLSQPIAIVPDGFIDLQWIDGVLRVAGPDRGANVETIPAGATIIGLRFLPASATAWLRVSASELVDTRLPLDVFWGPEARRLADWASDARTPEGIAHRLEAALARKGALVDPPDIALRSIFRIISTNRHPERQITHQLIDELGLSERTLRRRCREAFGYGPKTLDRILRFQRFLRLARISNLDGAARLSAEAGYADQSHLTREAQRLAGLTPKAIATQLSG
jgi:AraC-like DNA-binding protein